MFMLDDRDPPHLAGGIGGAYGGRPETTERFVVVDDGGFLGIVEPTGTLETESACYDGPCANLWEARWIERAKRASWGWVVAIGPVRARHASIRRTFPVPTPIPADGDSIGLIRAQRPTIGFDWPILASWDVDGDGTDDLLNRFRGCGAERVAIERQRRVNGAFVVVARSVEMRFE